MKRKILTLVTVFSMCCLVACDSEKTNDTNVNDNAADKATVTEAPADEPINEDISTGEAEITPAPEEATPEPTADPIETLTALRNEALAEQDAIEEVMQTQIDLVAPLLEVVKGLPNFEETPVYTSVVWSGAELESAFLEDDINSVLISYNYFIYTVNQLIATYPVLTETEEFQNLLNAPTFDMFMYELKVTIYNDTLANIATSGFEKLPYCLNDISSIEY